MKEIQNPSVPSFVNTPLNEISNIQHHLVALEHAFNVVEEKLKGKNGRKDIRSKTSNKYLSEQEIPSFYDHLETLKTIFSPCQFPNKDEEPAVVFSEEDSRRVAKWINVRRDNLAHKLEDLSKKVKNYKKIELNSCVVTQLFANSYQQELARQAQLLDMSVKRDIKIPSEAEIEEKILELKSSYTDEQKNTMKRRIAELGGAANIKRTLLPALEEKIKDSTDKLKVAVHHRSLITIFDEEKGDLAGKPIKSDERNRRIEQFQEQQNKQEDIDFLNNKSLKKTGDIKKNHKKISMEIEVITNNIRSLVAQAAELKDLDYFSSWYEKQNYTTHRFTVAGLEGMSTQFFGYKPVSGVNEDSYFTRNCLFAVPNPDLLIPHALRLTLNEAIKSIREKKENQENPLKFNAASTAAVAVIYGNKLYTLTVGDTRINLYEKVPGNPVTVTRLTADHDPADFVCHAHICANNGTIIYGESGEIRIDPDLDKVSDEQLPLLTKLGKGVKVGRNITGFGSEIKYVSEEPTITIYNLETCSTVGSEKKLSLGTDGLNEKGVTEQNYAEYMDLLIEKGSTFSQLEIGRILPIIAVINGSQDNITELDINFDLIDPKGIEKDRFVILGVFDGNAGPQVSSLLAKTFYTIFEKQIENLGASPLFKGHTQESKYQPNDDTKKALGIVSISIDQDLKDHYIVNFSAYDKAHAFVCDHAAKLQDVRFCNRNESHEISNFLNNDVIDKKGIRFYSGGYTLLVEKSSFRDVIKETITAGMERTSHAIG